MQQLGDADHLKITLISTNNDNNDDDDDDGKTKKLHTEAHHSGPGKQFVSFVMGAALFLLIWDTTFRAPQDRWLTKDKSTQFLEYAQANPHSAIVAFLLIIAVCVVFMIPIGTPLTLGCGYIYKGVYGWAGGMGLATFVSMAGSALGAVLCFLLGRYMMRDRVRLWIRKYPLFDAIDAAVAEHGLRIMAMLYLTPVLPLGPVSYMVGTTSMKLSSFVLAKVASLPLMTLYVFIGASAGTLIADADAIENNKTMIVLGIGLSVLMICGISYYIRQELLMILEKQGRKKKKSMDAPVIDESDDAIEMGNSSAPEERKTRHRRIAPENGDDSFVNNS